ncbi:MAG: sigma-70 family RNA polymerase sigma factor [Planctomycetota bacterium]
MPDPEIDVAVLVERVRRHDQEASRQLVGYLYPSVIGIVRSHRVRRSEETDLAQEVFLKVFSRLDHYVPRAGIPFDHWVSRLAVWTCLDALRTERRRPERRISELNDAQRAWLEFLTSDAPVNPVSDNAAARTLIDELLGGLKPEDRLVLEWLDLQELSVRQISERTGWSESSVKVRAFRARQKLRQLAIQLRKEFPL